MFPIPTAKCPFRPHTHNSSLTIFQPIPSGVIASLTAVFFISGPAPHGSLSHWPSLLATFSLSH
ncbi:unnamed protein product, partial [Vitis vinifera]|uniref:Uncharacterized protein n=1 Tax=Vitis vinifera TaxID=29760 RepID=D7UB49_VITVI